jgi:hypothetical protein
MTAKTVALKPKAAMKPRITVAEYLTAQIDLCGKSQMEIARECGFEKPNIITMIKQGKSKLPIARVGVFAHSLGVDAGYLYSLAMQEYEPETWSMIQDLVMKQPYVSENEMEILEVVRSSNVVNPKIRTIEEKERLLTAINKLRPDNAVSGD